MISANTQKSRIVNWGNQGRIQCEAPGAAKWLNLRIDAVDIHDIKHSRRIWFLYTVIC